MYGQPTFVDTLNTLPFQPGPAMGNVFELPSNQGYAVSHFANYFLNITYTDINGQRTGQKSWKIADSLSSSHSTRSCTKRADGSYLIVTQERGNCGTCDYGGIYCLNNYLEDTLWTKKIRYNYQSVEYPIFLDYVKAAPNNTIWTAGLMAFNSNVISHITHLSANGNIIAQNHFTLSTGRNFVQYLLPTPDGGCLIGLIEAGNSSPSTQQVTFLKVNAAGQQEWYRQFGNTAYRDADPFVLRAANANEYWLVFTEGANTSNDNFHYRIKGIRVNSAGVTLETRYLQSYKLINGDIFDAYQDTNGDVTFAINYPILGSNGHLWKFSSNMDSLWRKQIPQPNYSPTWEELSPYHLIKATNGDYICGGWYRNNFTDAILLTRLDSLGCLVVGTESVIQTDEMKIKIFPNPTNNNAHIEWNENLQSPIKIEIINSIGQAIEIIKIENNTTYQDIDTKNLPNGIYYLTLYDKNNLIHTTKFVVLHE